MQCDRLQQRIDEILDRREGISADREVVAHLADCHACRRLVRAYEVMLLGIDLVGQAAEPEHEFVQRTVETADRRRRRAGVARRLSAALAVAAAVLVAASPVWFRAVNRPHGRPDVPLAKGASASSPATRSAVSSELSSRRLAQMWQATGRNLATLPQTVKRVAALPETDRIVGPIRPLAEPVGAAWEVFLRAWPDTTTISTPIPESDTGYVSWQGARHA